MFAVNRQTKSQPSWDVVCSSSQHLWVGSQVVERLLDSVPEKVFISDDICSINFVLNFTPKKIIQRIEVGGSGWPAIWAVPAYPPPRKSGIQVIPYIICVVWPGSIMCKNHPSKDFLWQIQILDENWKLILQKVEVVRSIHPRRHSYGPNLKNKQFDGEIYLLFLNLENNEFVFKNYQTVPNHASQNVYWEAKLRFSLQD